MSNVIFWYADFYVVTILIVQGREAGIEQRSARLMPALFVLFAMLFIYILSQQGAWEGLKHYLIPDFEKSVGS